MMHMTCYWGRRVTILFNSWKIDSWIGFLLSLFTCFIFSIFYQYMDDRHLHFKLFSVSKTSPPPFGAAALSTPLLLSKMGGCNWSPSPSRIAFPCLIFRCGRWVQAWKMGLKSRVYTEKGKADDFCLGKMRHTVWDYFLRVPNTQKWAKKIGCQTWAHFRSTSETGQKRAQAQPFFFFILSQISHFFLFFFFFQFVFLPIFFFSFFPFTLLLLHLDHHHSLPHPFFPKSHH